MAYDIPGTRHSFEATGDLTGSWYKFVKMAGSGISAVAAATDLGIGVLQNKPNGAGVVGTVMVDGITKVLASKAITAGVPVYLAADGRVTDTAASNKAVGISVTAATGADKIVSVMLKPLGALS
jgi:hypothetical protein